MTREPTPPHREPVLSEDAAHRLLARAVELDAHRASQVSVAQLREIASEAGIAVDAFDDALAEFRSLTEVPAEPSKPGFTRAIRRWWRNTDATHLDERWSRSMWKGVTINVLAFAIFWVGLSAFSRFSGSLGLDWPADHAGRVFVNLVGLGVALRLRARVTSIILGVTAAAQLAGYVMHLFFGIRTVQGGPTNWALMLAGLAGMAFGVVLTRSRRPPAHGLPGVADGVARETSQPSAPPSDQPPPVSLRLRTA
jgi:hypothetical protein